LEWIWHDLFLGADLARSHNLKDCVYELFFISGSISIFTAQAGNSLVQPGQQQQQHPQPAGSDTTYD
jgi:hypothetical protein